MTKLAKWIEFGPADRLRALIQDQMVSRRGGDASSNNPLRILDIGSGGAAYWESILNQWGMDIELTLFDPMRPSNLHELQKVSAVTHIEGLAPLGLRDLAADSFDVCTGFDLIEHLSREDGHLLLYEIDRLTVGTSILFTPNGFVWQEPSKNNPFNAHISGWSPAELARMGWLQARGHTGLRVLFGPYGLPAFAKSPVRQLSFLTAILVRYLPRLSFAFSAVRSHLPFRETNHGGLAT